MESLLEREEDEPPSRARVLVAYTACPAAGDAADAGLARRAEADDLHHTAEAVHLALAARGYEVDLAPVHDDLAPVLDRVRRERPDVVFNLVDSVGGSDRREPELPRHLKALGVPVTGASARVLEAAYAKDVVRAALVRGGVPVAPSVIARHPRHAAQAAALRFPLIVKPARTDGSIGIDQGSVVRDEQALRERVAATLAAFEGPALVEEYLPGPELSLAALPTATGVRQALTAMDFSELPEGLWPIVTYACKWVEDSPEYVGASRPAAELIGEDVRREAAEVGWRAVRALRIDGPARVDMRVDRDGAVRVIDLNPNPDLDPAAGFAKAMASVGVPYGVLVHELARAAMARAARRSRRVGGTSAALRPRVAARPA